MPRFALIQTRSSTDIQQNIDVISSQIAQAAQHNPNIICLPEMVNIIQKDHDKLAQEITIFADDIFIKAAQEWAKSYQCWINLGSCALKSEKNNPDQRYYNRNVMINNDGEIVSHYDKIHLFDVKLANGEYYKESDTYQHGKNAVICDTPWGKMGFTICYDLRFSQLYRDLALQGADFILAPAAFTQFTGKAHWHLLTRARAIETGAYIIAAGQGGTHDDGRKTYGHSLVVNPWGEIIGECDHEKPDILIVDCDAGLCEKVRTQIPSLQHHREFQ